MNFKGAIFDLDGTILASNHIWEKVDKIFLERRNIKIPADYLDNLAFLSTREGAIYTIDRFNLSDTQDEILLEWQTIADQIYIDMVSLKPHALDYIKYLKSNGVKLAVATGMPEVLYKPTLEKLEILDLFDVTSSVDEVGVGKGSPDVFYLTLKKLDLEAKECIAFEDIPTAIKSAKLAGLTVFGVYDSHSAHLQSEMEAAGDGYIEDMRFAPRL